MRTALIGLIIMQITLVPDSLAPATLFAAILDGRHFFNMAEAFNF